MAGVGFIDDVATGVQGDLQGLMSLSETAAVVANNDETLPSSAAETTKTKAAAAAEPGCAEGEKKKKKMFLLHLPREEIDRVLSWKRRHLSPDVVSAEDIAAFDAISDNIEEYQTWMRRELERNGGDAVMVDEEFVACREYRLKLWEEETAPVEWSESELAYWNIIDDLSDDDEYEDEDVREEAETN